MVRFRIKLGPKGQVVIPKVFRDEYKMMPGSDVVLEEGQEGVLVRKRDKDPFDVLTRIREELKRKGKKIKVAPHEIYSQFKKREEKAGI
ncbi:AbrB/MazE/SpoVT family DNA-binding domain-containing protein [Candidatus Woesearchaeota archaeon]|nr:AbrB/MazE/SpoVT family DNA-binding domain-containing protein [Candidatus Woesearchaeota archaeon]